MPAVSMGSMAYVPLDTAWVIGATAAPPSHPSRSFCTALKWFTPNADPMTSKRSPYSIFEHEWPMAALPHSQAWE